ncbi:uncharacterized protein LOC119670551, partial [Teleopsis dalmanni]|uniref:uncharacterized protein LOC119670551 n=1 Tax=Teleopsis dalmanni TaxID=139649 RepID=UPI0018CF8E36
NEVPFFLNEQVVYLDKIIINAQKSCLILTRNLRFYEYQQKQLIQTIDLSRTCLSKIENQIKTYEGPKQKYTFTIQKSENKSDTSDSDTEEIVCEPHKDECFITFGKYIFNNFNLFKVYIIIKCWDKFIVLEKNLDSKGFRFIAEYENVKSYSLARSNVLYQEVVKITFTNGETILSDFQETVKDIAEKNDESNTLKNEFKDILNSINDKQQELHILKRRTNEQFVDLLKDKRFGSNFLIMFHLDDKQMITRCGDVWFRFTLTDECVIGISLLNTCNTSTLTILKNIRPILNTHAKSSSIEFYYCLYELKRNFDDIETLEAFFQSEDDNVEANIWTPNEQQQLSPETFGVLLIKLNISQLITLENVGLFILFEIEKDLQFYNDLPSDPQVCEQQMFITDININDLLRKRPECEILFKSKTMHQDFLATAFTSFETKLLFDFNEKSDVDIFERLLSKIFQVEVIKRAGTSEIPIEQDTQNFAMEVDEKDVSVEMRFPHKLFYNKTRHSLWYGLLILKVAAECEKDEENLKIQWKFYLQNSEKSLLFFKTLFNEIDFTNCNIQAIEEISIKQSAVNVKNFEHAIRKELKAVNDFISNKNETETENFVAHLTKLQLETDLLAQDLQAV